LLPYHGNAINVRFCPSAVLTNASYAGDTQGSADHAWYWSKDPITWGSYGYNGWFYSGATTYGDPVKYFRKESAIQKPSQTPAFADAVWTDSWPLVDDKAPNPADLYDGADIYSDPGMGRFLIARHGKGSPSSAARSINTAFVKVLPGKVNVASVDSHVELTPLDNLWQLYWHIDYVPAKRP
jgi:hypothetical protein